MSSEYSWSFVGSMGYNPDWSPESTEKQNILETNLNIWNGEERNKMLYSIQITETRKEWVVVDAENPDKAYKIAQTLYDENMLNPSLPADDPDAVSYNVEPITGEISGSYLRASRDVNGEILCRLVGGNE